MNYIYPYEKHAIIGQLLLTCRMFVQVKKILLTIGVVFLNVANIQAQNANASLIEELVLSIDSTCIFISPETHTTYIQEDFNEKYYGGEMSNHIDSITFVKLIKKIPQKTVTKKLLQDSFIRIKVVPFSHFDSVRASAPKAIRYGDVSQPIFDNTKQYAILNYSTFGTREWASGCLYLLKRNGDRWFVIAAFDCIL